MSAYVESDWRGRIAITAADAVTPVGYSAEASIAAMRAGISRLGELPYLEIEVDKEEMGPVIGAEIPEIPKGRQGTARLSNLLQFITPRFTASMSASLSGSHGRLYLATAHPSEGGQLLSGGRDQLLNNVLNQTATELAIADQALVADGRAAGLSALRQAATAISTGQCDFALVYAVDSWVSPRALLWLQEQGRLREYPRRTGMLPGEAAAAVCLESEASAERRGATVLAWLTAASGKQETTPIDQPNQFPALAHAVAHAADGVSEREALVISDHNGERYRALEWANTVTKSMWYYRNIRHWHPAEFIGDSGAASGLLTTLWAATALHRDYARTDHVLVWGASDQGQREAAMLTTAGRAN